MKYLPLEVHSKGCFSYPNPSFWFYHFKQLSIPQAIVHDEILNMIQPMKALNWHPKDKSFHDFIRWNSQGLILG